MTRVAHRRMKRAVSAYVDGELDDAAAAAVAVHLRECWDCSGDADLTRMVKRSLGNLGDRLPDTLAAIRLQRFAARLTN
ncbi:MAG: zf-HC2 domain-containing protein [Acidimicrobiales bacterium]